MGKEKINIPAGKMRILVAPLDWGLGHATRCIPIIHELLANGCEVLVAAENGTKSLLQKEFPQLVFLPLAGYGVKYSNRKSWMPVKILLQSPKLFYSIYKEHQWLQKAVKIYTIDAVISDNRFGLFHRSILSVYITHQLAIKTGNRFSENIAQKIHSWFIKKYNVCWVPDFEGDKNIAGDLSHPKKKLLNVTYLGCLSRFEKKPAVNKKYKLIIIISGPEPQRAIFENIVLKQLQFYKDAVLFVRGLPNIISTKESENKNILIVNHLLSEELNIAIQQSDYVISRSGYTTVMDLIKLKQKAIFVPTPGQTEQEYLAEHLAKQKLFFYATQENFSLEKSLQEANSFPFIIPEFNMEKYKIVIADFVQALKKRNL